MYSGVSEQKSTPKLELFEDPLISIATSFTAFAIFLSVDFNPHSLA